MTDSPSSTPHRRTVVLCHTLPDASWHLDWMLERDTNDDHRLVTFRLETRPDELTAHQTTAHRLPDHRARYLDYQGPLSDARGSLTRLARGDVLDLSISGSSLAATIRWSERVSLVHAECKEGDLWALRWEPTPIPG